MMISGTKHLGAGLSLQKGLGNTFELLIYLYPTVISTDISYRHISLAGSVYHQCSKCTIKSALVVPVVLPTSSLMFIALRVLLCRLRFTETDLCSLYRVVKEEISDDNAKLPCFNGRVVSWVGSKYILDSFSGLFIFFVVVRLSVFTVFVWFKWLCGNCVRACVTMIPICWPVTTIILRL